MWSASPARPAKSLCPWSPVSCVLSDPPPSGLEEVGQSPRELCKWSPLTFSSVWLAGWSLFAFFSEAGASPPWEGHLVKILPWGDEQDADLCTGGDGTVSFDISGTGSESQAKALVLPPVVRTGTTSPAAPPTVPGTACSYLGHPPLASLGTVGLLVLEGNPARSAPVFGTSWGWGGSKEEDFW